MVELRKNINVLAILLIPLYLLVMGNSILNRHTHILPNGMVITHSHPFTDSKTGLPVQHNHTRNQIVFFQLFTFDFFESSPEVILTDNHISLKNETKIWHTELAFVSFISATFLRGPPTV